jgi:NAD(P)-dependent dehydrogenase (short-subunit alcohol dehydrogenase family)
MKSFGGKVAAITGAGSGIGRALSVELAGMGCDLALSDVDDVGLADTMALVARAGSVKSIRSHVDVADRDAVETWAGEVMAEFGRANIIVNNAGVALGASVSSMSYESLRWLMDINFWGVVHGTMAFLPHLKHSGQGHVVNISSVFGLVGIPTQSAYNASKFGVRGFTESLRIELDIERCGVSATSIHPGGIRTNIARNGRFDPDPAGRTVDADKAASDFDRFARTSPEKAAQLILGAIAKNKRRAMIGPDAHVFDAAARISPRLACWSIGKLAARTDNVIV